MERKIGEVFEFEGKKYEVVEDDKPDKENDCYKCIFDIEPGCFSSTRGVCCSTERTDGKEVVFIEVRE